MPGNDIRETHITGKLLDFITLLPFESGIATPLEFSNAEALASEYDSDSCKLSALAPTRIVSDGKTQM